MTEDVEVRGFSRGRLVLAFSADYDRYVHGMAQGLHQPKKLSSGPLGTVFKWYTDGHFPHFEVSNEREKDTGKTVRHIAIPSQITDHRGLQNWFRTKQSKLLKALSHFFQLLLHRVLGAGPGHWLYAKTWQRPATSPQALGEVLDQVVSEFLSSQYLEDSLVLLP